MSLTIKNPDFSSSEIKVFIQAPLLGDEEQIFLDHGYELVSHLEEADLVVFTGGSDISPTLYGEVPHAFYSGNSSRDIIELETYRKSKGKFKVGLCRGGQLLNVLSGGKLWQDVDGHHGSHWITDIITGNKIMTTSIHHQAFRPGKDAIHIAYTKLSTRKESQFENWYQSSSKNGSTDYEVLFYPDTRCLCVQFHPEFGATPECIEYFFNLIERYYGIGGVKSVV